MTPTSRTGFYLRLFLKWRSFKNLMIRFIWIILLIVNEKGTNREINLITNRWNPFNKPDGHFPPKCLTTGRSKTTESRRFRFRFSGLSIADIWSGDSLDYETLPDHLWGRRAQESPSGTLWTRSSVLKRSKSSRIAPKAGWRACVRVLRREKLN